MQLFNKQNQSDISPLWSNEQQLSLVVFIGPQISRILRCIKLSQWYRLSVHMSFKNDYMKMIQFFFLIVENHNEKLISYQVCCPLFMSFSCTNTRSHLITLKTANEHYYTNFEKFTYNLNLWTQTTHIVNQKPKFNKT